MKCEGDHLAFAVKFFLSIRAYKGRILHFARAQNTGGDQDSMLMDATSVRLVTSICLRRMGTRMG